MQPYKARSFRFIELLRVGPSRTDTIWRMKLYGIACRRELPRAALLRAARRIAEEPIAEGKSKQLPSRIYWRPRRPRRRICLCRFGETRTNCFIVSFFPETTIRRSWRRRNRRTRPFAFGICICNPLSARLGLSMCCAKLTRPISMDTSLNVCTKMPNF